MSTGTSLRNVFVYDNTSSPPTVVAGLYQPPAGIWKINTFYRILKLCFEQQSLPPCWRLVSSSDNSILSPASEQSLLAGSYFVANSAGLSCRVDLSTTVFHRRNATPSSTPSVCYLSQNKPVLMPRVCSNTIGLQRSKNGMIIDVLLWVSRRRSTHKRVISCPKRYLPQ